jgi:hypothetical protein
MQIGVGAGATGFEPETATQGNCRVTRHPQKVAVAGHLFAATSVRFPSIWQSERQGERRGFLQSLFNFLFIYYDYES